MTEDQVKVILLGDTGVGKTSIILSFADGVNILENQQSSTVGVDLRKVDLKIDETVVKMQIWDTAGQEQYRAIAKSFIRRADGILLCFDLTRHNSFDHIPEWIETIKEQSLSNTPCVLIGNKCDMESAISRASITNIAESYKMPYYETSATRGIGLEAAFFEIARSIIKSRKSQVTDVQLISPDTNQKNTKTKPKCC